MVRFVQLGALLFTAQTVSSNVNDEVDGLLQARRADTTDQWRTTDRWRTDWPGATTDSATADRWRTDWPDSTTDSPDRSCDFSLDLSHLMSPFTGSTSDGHRNLVLSCGGIQQGREEIFFYDLPAGSTIDIGMDSNDYDSRHETRWGGSCPGTNIVECTDDPDYRRHQWTNNQGSSQRVYFIIDAYRAGNGSFTLTWSVEDANTGTTDWRTDRPDSTTSASESENCRSYCQNEEWALQYSWDDKCNWPQCAGCSPCNSFTDCHRNCNGGTWSWDAKCRWGKCSQCSECGAATTDHWRTDWPDSTTDSPDRSCDFSLDLFHLTSPFRGSTLDGHRNLVLSCGGIQEGREEIFFYDLPAGSTIDIGMDSNDYDSRHETRWGGSCPGTNIVECTDDPDYRRHQWTNNQGSSQRVYFIIDAYRAGNGSFTLTWSVEDANTGTTDWRTDWPDSTTDPDSRHCNYRCHDDWSQFGDWDERCTWSECSGCSRCNNFSECDRRCDGNTWSWDAKCRWGKCSQCSECGAATTDGWRTDWPDSTTGTTHGPGGPDGPHGPDVPCRGDRAGWRSEHGVCEDYEWGKHLQDHCHDYDPITHFTAYESCFECGHCMDSPSIHSPVYEVHGYVRVVQDGDGSGSGGVNPYAATRPYFLAPGGMSCEQACMSQGKQCWYGGIVAAAESVAVCKSIIESLGMTPQHGGQYPDDNAGCTYHPDQEGWYQVMRKDDDPNCDVVNADRSRQRVCACMEPH